MYPTSVQSIIKAITPWLESAANGVALNLDDGMYDAYYDDNSGEYDDPEFDIPADCTGN